MAKVQTTDQEKLERQVKLLTRENKRYRTALADRDAIVDQMRDGLSILEPPPPYKPRNVKMPAHEQDVVYLFSDCQLGERIEAVEIDRSSGSKVLDTAAVRIVELAAPYAAFPEDMRRQADILSITRTWTFTRSDYLTSQ